MSEHACRMPNLAVLMLLVDGRPRPLGEIGLAIGLCPRAMVGVVSMLRAFDYARADACGLWRITERGLRRAWSSRVQWLQVARPPDRRHRPPHRRRKRRAAPAAATVVVLPSRPRSWCDV